MKIAHIASPWVSIPPKNYGGTETVLSFLINEQIQQGHEVSLFGTEDSTTKAKNISFFKQGLLEKNVPWHAHLQPFLHFYQSVAYIKKHRSDFDIIHTHLSSASDLYLYPLLSEVQIPHVATLHSQFPFDRLNDWVGEGDEQYLPWLLQVPFVAISQSAKKNCILPLQFIDIVYHGLPTEHFDEVNSLQDDYFVWLGRIAPEKGTHLAIEAALKANVKLVLAGIVDTYFDSSRRYFEEKIKPYIDGNKITFIGPVNIDDKKKLFAKAQGFLNPLQWEEPFGMVMIESMAMGCPVISFARGAALELIHENINGYLVTDVDEMVEKIQKIQLLDRHSVREDTLKHFASSVMAENYQLVYEKILQSKDLL